MYFWISLPFLWLSFFCPSGPSGPPQPSDGPGGAAYVHDGVRFSDQAGTAEGYWLFEPESPSPDSAPVVVFLHGYGAINPMIYGGWVSHIVRQGNIVIYPRYQQSLLSPGSEAFAGNAAKGILDALAELGEGSHVRPQQGPLVLVGHSYGGAIAANLGVRFTELGIPQPKGLLLCAPGTGPLKGGRLDSYEDMPADTRLLIMVSVDDQVVGDELGRLIFETAVHTPHRNLLRQFPDEHGEPAVTAGHNECYALDARFDADIHNLSYYRALRIAKNDALDYYGYWKLLDALLSCVRSDEYCDTAFGDTPAQRSLGQWSDGEPVKGLEVLLPAEDTTVR